jgi:hypothetical protein
MPDDNKVAAVTDRPDDGVRVLRPTCRLVLARKVDRDRIVSALTQRGRDEVPVPGAPPPPWMSANAATLSDPRCGTGWLGSTL